MTLGEMIEPLKTPRRIEFRDPTGNTICYTDSDSLGCKPYHDYIVTRWFPVFGSDLGPFLQAGDLVIWIKEPNNE